MPAPIHIFRPGRHQPMSGTAIDFSEAILTAIASGYNPTKHEAPLVVGHPSTNAPAYGWVKGLTATDEGLFATPHQVDPAFAELVNTGKFKKISASFYPPTSPANPTPGQYYLRHVGFLGAEPPAVKGLKPVSFAENDTEVLTIEFAEDTELRTGLVRILRSFRDWLIGKHGLETADQVLGSWEIEWLAPKPEQHAFSEDTPMPNPISNLPAAAAVAPTVVDAERLKSLEAEVASFREQTRRDAAQRLIDKTIADGRLTPAQAEGLAEFMAAAETSISFAEPVRGDGGAATHNPTNQKPFMETFLSRLPKQVDFSEASAPQDGADDPVTVQDLARDALSYQEKLSKSGQIISITDAVAAVSKGKHKE